MGFTFDAHTHPSEVWPYMHRAAQEDSFSTTIRFNAFCWCSCVAIGAPDAPNQLGHYLEHNKLFKSASPGSLGGVRTNYNSACSM